MAEKETENRRETEKYDWLSMIQTDDNRSYFSVSLRFSVSFSAIYYYPLSIINRNRKFPNPRKIRSGK